MSKTKRLLFVCNMLAKILFEYIRRRPDSANLIIVDSFKQLGGIYTKFLQLLALQPRFFEEWEINNKLEIYDRVESEELDINAVLMQSMSSEQRAQFSFVDDRVAAGGSFAQIYKGQLTDGTDVAIKVLRPTVATFLKFDQATIRILCIILDLFSSRFGNIKFKTIFSEFKEVTTNETNYTREIYYANKLYERYKEHPVIVVPRTFRRLSSQTVIVQEYIDGVPMTDVVSRHASQHDSQEFIWQQTGSDLHYVLSELAYDMFIQGLTDNDSQGDPHPGNLFIMPGNKVGLIDFGIIGTPPANRSAFYELLVKQYYEFYEYGFQPEEFFKRSLQFYSNDLYQSLRYLESAGLDDDSILNNLAKSAAKMYEQKKSHAVVKGLLSNTELRSIFLQVINPDNRFGIDITIDGGVFQKATNTFMSMLDHLECKHTVLRVVYGRIVNYVETNGLPVQAETSMSPEESAAVLSSWMERVASKDPLLLGNLLKTNGEFR